MNLNKSLDSFIAKTLWVWLPFYAFFELIHELGEHMEKDHHHTEKK